MVDRYWNTHTDMVSQIGKRVKLLEEDLNMYEPHEMPERPSPEQ